MYAVKENKDACKTYHDVCMQYVNYLKNYLIPAKIHVTVVFNRYNDRDSMKNNEQLRRYRHIILQFQI